MYRLKLGKFVTTTPTIGFNVENLVINGMDIDCWDISGRGKIRPLWRHHYSDASGLVFVVDSCDHDRLDESLEELIRILMVDTIKPGIVCMILVNKQDISGSISSEVVEERWKTKYAQLVKDTSSVIEQKHCVFFTRPCSMLTGDGLLKAFEEFTLQLQGKESRHIDEKEEKNIEISLKTLCQNPLNFFKYILMY